MATTSYERMYTLRNQAIDELLTDIELFREHVSLICAELRPEDRTSITRITDAYNNTPTLLDTIHDSLLPTLRRMSTKAHSKQLHAVIGESFLLEDDEATLITSGLLEKRTAHLLHNFIEDSVRELPSDRIMTVRDSAMKLLGGKTAGELAALYAAYAEYTAYTSVAAHCNVSYIDPHASRRVKRASAKQIEREQATYAETLKNRRWNISYRINQISKIYDRLPDVIVAEGWSLKELSVIREAYDKPTPKGLSRAQKNMQQSQSFLKATEQFVADETAKRLRKDELSLRVAIDTRQEIEHHLAHLMNLTPIQFSHLPQLTREFKHLLAEQQRIQKV